jgi:hypothetical protein
MMHAVCAERGCEALKSLKAGTVARFGLWAFTCNAFHTFTHLYVQKHFEHKRKPLGKK